MRTDTKGLLGGGIVGLIVAGALALPSLLPAAMAQDEPARTLLKTADELLPKTLTASMFVKPEWTIEPWVSEEIQSRTTIRKIGYGRTSFVSIMTTPTGTYSTDGLASPHIRYPGIVRNSETSSLVTIVPPDGAGFVIVGNDESCVTTRHSIIC